MQSEVQGINFDAGALGCELPICLGVTFISRLSSVYFFDERARQKTGRFHTTKSGTDEIRRDVTRLGKLREPIKATEWARTQPRLRSALFHSTIVQRP
jgi:hypothetical protein